MMPAIHGKLRLFAHMATEVVLNIYKKTNGLPAGSMALIYLTMTATRGNGFQKKALMLAGKLRKVRVFFLQVEMERLGN